MKLSLVCFLFSIVSFFGAPEKARLANDVEMERARLNDLNDRMNAFELELAPNKP